jgi:hypothetical protein
MLTYKNDDGCQVTTIQNTYITGWQVSKFIYNLLSRNQRLLNKDKKVKKKMKTFAIFNNLKIREKLLKLKGISL